MASKSELVKESGFKNFHKDWNGSTVPMQGCNVWNIDTGAAFKGPLTLMDVETNQFWQSDLVINLYPGENGRNNN